MAEIPPDISVLSCWSTFSIHPLYLSRMYRVSLNPGGSQKSPFSSSREPRDSEWPRLQPISRATHPSPTSSQPKTGAMLVAPARPACSRQGGCRQRPKPLHDRSEQPPRQVPLLQQSSQSGGSSVSHRSAQTETPRQAALLPAADHRPGSPAVSPQVIHTGVHASEPGVHALRWA
jgi:hypothetical protein